MSIKSIRQLKDLSGRRVLLRADFNVPVKNGRITEDYKLKQTLPTLDYLRKKKAKVSILSHLGRPDKDNREECSLEPVARRLESLLRQKVKFLDKHDDFRAGTEVTRMKAGEVLLFENIRYQPGEEKNDRRLAKRLAVYGDLYVNDAFGVSHRAHASVSAIKRYLPAFAGLLLEKEVGSLSRALDPEKPLVVIIGGAKIKTKIKMIKNLYGRAHRILIGGALANNFFRARGLETGRSLIDSESVRFAAKHRRSRKIIIPEDVVVGRGPESRKPARREPDKVAGNEYILDIGPDTVCLFSHFIKRANTIIWNGPLGYFENPRFRHGTAAIALAASACSRGKAFGVAGGGETVAALRAARSLDGLDWVSTGGGAMLAFLGGEKMPGLSGIIQ